jgi:hypothetical protein
VWFRETSVVSGPGVPIFGLFNDVFSSSDYNIAPNDTMIDE